MKPVTKDAYQLMHEGCLALAEIESVGMRVDESRLDKTIRDASKRIDQLSGELKDTTVWKSWRKRWGDKSNLGSRYQLGVVLMGESEKRHKVDEAALEKLDNPFVKRYLELEKLKKLKSTYLMGVKREVVDGLLHPVFNLHLVKTFRSSSDSPNFQNIPIRDREMGKLIRSCFIPRPGRTLVEMDYGALEFRVAACFWRDKAMIDYASSSELDIHRDMATECYLIDSVPKMCRFHAKNCFVFPTLYGSYYKNCARDLWNAIDQSGLVTNDGQGIREHLHDCGIHKLGDCDPRESPIRGTFEYHIREVEQQFNDRFPEWSKRKEKWWKQYLDTGKFRVMTGFECKGVFKRNDLYNWPVQGPAFHLMLWSLIQMVKWLKKNKMQSCIVGQIHDSKVSDVDNDELDEYIKKAKQVMTEDVREHWSWVVTPLVVEVETSTTNWFEKREYLGS